MPTDLILGTAGHIDHGKTTLVKALTGVDTDRLPEEKKRGITIELGFAELTLGSARLGIVDVPGHERFVRNMLAGATGVDMALLVVAADDSVKPQTREHLEILKLLDLSTGVIALTKCDLADPEWISLVEAEVRDLVQDTFLAEAPLIRTSAHTGNGLEELRSALADAADQRARSRERDDPSTPFRLAIDRSFTVAGHGTVVTGSGQTGTIAVGDSLTLEPDDITVRVRGLHNHDRQVERIDRGQRAAINLAGIHHDQIRRGHELASPGHLVPSQRLTVRLNLLASVARPLKNRARVRIHVGTAELMASVVLLEGDELAPGQTVFAQVFLREAAVATWGQAFVIRSESPVATIGGGVVLDPTAAKLRRNRAMPIDQLRSLSQGEPLERASAALFFAGLRKWQPADLARTAGVTNVDEVVAQLRQCGDLVEIEVSPTRTIPLHDAVLGDISDRFRRSLERLHDQFPLQRFIDQSRLFAQFKYLPSTSLLDAIIDRLVDEGQVSRRSQGIALAGHGPQLSKNQHQLLDEIVRTLQEGGCKPPFVAELQARAERNRAAVPELCQLAAAEGQLVKITNEFYLHHEVYADVRAKLTQWFSEGEGLTLSEIRERLETSRKFAVPICEHLDEIGFTHRQGDRRVLANADAVL
jgi:selenocysteine-specific elongation factor